MILTLPQLCGLLLSILGIAGLAVWSGTRPQSYANVNSAPIVSGLIIGTLVGGSSTVGTAQLAYNYGLSAWWFTLGGGLACIVLAVFYIKPLRRSDCLTLTAIVGREFGLNAHMAASVLSCIGTFINVLSQLLAGTAVIAVVFPEAGLVTELVVTAAFMALYAIVGGTQGAGRVGIFKTTLLYVAMIGCALTVLKLTGGVSGFLSEVRSIDTEVNLMSLFARGFGKDCGACLSLILGVLTTQTYAMAVMSAKSDRAARIGALSSAVLIPPIGVGGILVGLYMRSHYPLINTKTALTSFALNHLPPLVGGLVLGALFIAVVGTGAGLAMGISTILRRDIIAEYTDRFSDAKTSRHLSNLILLVVLILGCFLCLGSFGDTILSFAFMSMGLRGAVVFVPLCCALWLPGRVNPRWVLAAIIAGPVFVLLCGTICPLPFGIDALFAGVTAALICCILGLLMPSRKHTDTLEA